MKNEIKTGRISIKGNENHGSGNIGTNIYSTAEELPGIIPSVPYMVHESAMARNERHIRRLVISLIVSIITLFAANIGWLWFLSQFEFESTEISSEGGGNANYIGEDGNIYNGTYQGSEDETQKR